MADYTMSIEFEAGSGLVFDYLVTEAGMTAWMGQRATINPCAGGSLAVDIAGHAIRGQYLEVERPHRVVVSWGMAGSTDLPAGASTMEFTLKPTSHGTRVEMVHSQLPDSRLDGHADGWTHFLGDFASMPPGGTAEADDWVPLEDRTT